MLSSLIFDALLLDIMHRLIIIETYFYHYAKSDRGYGRDHDYGDACYINIVYNSYKRVNE